MIEEDWMRNLVVFYTHPWMGLLSDQMGLWTLVLSTTM